MLCCVESLLRVSTAAGRRYAISDELFTSGACGEHVKLLEKYLTSPIHLGRAGISLQGANSWQNIRSVLRRYLGYCLQSKGEGAVADAGLLCILDGPSVAGYAAWLLQTRETSLTTCVQTMLAVEKVAHWAISEFYPEEADGAAYVGTFTTQLLMSCLLATSMMRCAHPIFADRCRTMTRQMQTWHQKVNKLFIFPPIDPRSPDTDAQRA